MAKKKRYYQSKSDRRSESRGMLERLGEEFYAGIHGRAADDRMAEGMIREDKNAMANLPQEVMIKQYPRVRYEMDENINDNLRGIDRQMEDDGKKQKRGAFPEKY
jgi:hypothetical protein